MVFTEEFYARYDIKKVTEKSFVDSPKDATKKEELPLPDGYAYRQKIAYINSETHDIAIKEEIFVES